jgi:hypothetical protein
MAQGFYPVNYSDQLIVLDGKPLYGVQGLQLSRSSQGTPIKILGYGVFDTILNEPVTHTLTIDSVYFSGENFTDFYSMLSGEVAISGDIYQNDKKYTFGSGYCTQYSLDVSVGSPIKRGCSIDIYGDFLVTDCEPTGFLTGVAPGIVALPNFTHVILNDNFSGSCFSSFGYTAKLDKSPIYKIGSIAPVLVKANYPITHSMEFSLNVLKSETILEAGSGLCNEYKDDVYVVANSRCDDQNLFTFAFSGAKLQSQNISSSIGNRMTMNLSYVAYDWGHAKANPEPSLCLVTITGYKPSKKRGTFDPPIISSQYQILGYQR